MGSQAPALIRGPRRADAPRRAERSRSAAGCAVLAWRGARMRAALDPIEANSAVELTATCRGSTDA